MLKSFLHIAVSFLLLATTTGFTITKHYCGSDLISVAIGTEAESCCDGPCDCCHDETQHFQVEDDFVPGVINLTFENIASYDLLNVPVLLFVHAFSREAANDVSSTLSDKHLPPRLTTSLPVLQTFLL